MFYLTFVTIILKGPILKPIKLICLHYVIKFEIVYFFPELYYHTTLTHPSTLSPNFVKTFGFSRYQNVFSISVTDSLNSILYFFRWEVDYGDNLMCCAIIPHAVDMRLIILLMSNVILLKTPNINSKWLAHWNAKRAFNPQFWWVNKGALH